MDKLINKFNEILMLDIKSYEDIKTQIEMIDLIFLESISIKNRSFIDMALNKSVQDITDIYSENVAKFEEICKLDLRFKKKILMSEYTSGFNDDDTYKNYYRLAVEEIASHQYSYYSSETENRYVNECIKALNNLENYRCKEFQTNLETSMKNLIDIRKKRFYKIKLKDKYNSLNINRLDEVAIHSIALLKESCKKIKKNEYTRLKEVTIDSLINDTDVNEFIIDFLNKLSSDWSDIYQKNIVEQNYNYFDKPNKISDNFCVSIPFQNLAFISTTFRGYGYEVFQIIHELGHCIYIENLKEITNHNERRIPIYFGESIAYFFEMLLFFHSKELFNKDIEYCLKNYYRVKLTKDMIWSHTITEFEKTVYDCKNTRNFIETFIDIYKENNKDTKMQDSKIISLLLKCRTFFELPLYYNDYLIAQTCAIKLLNKYVLNPKDTIISIDTFMKSGFTMCEEDIYHILGISNIYTGLTMSEIETFEKIIC